MGFFVKHILITVKVIYWDDETSEIIIDRITKGHKKRNLHRLFTLCEMGSNEVMQCISQKKET